MSNRPASPIETESQIERYITRSIEEHEGTAAKMAEMLVRDPSYAVKWYAEEVVKTGWHYRNALKMREMKENGIAHDLLDAFAIIFHEAKRELGSELHGIGTSSGQGHRLEQAARIEVIARFIDSGLGWALSGVKASDLEERYDLIVKEAKG